LFVVARRDLKEQHRYAINYRADALAVANVALGCICERLHLHTRRHGRGARMELREISTPRSPREREGGNRVGGYVKYRALRFFIRAKSHINFPSALGRDPRITLSFNTWHCFYYLLYLIARSRNSIDLSYFNLFREEIIRARGIFIAAPFDCRGMRQRFGDLCYSLKTLKTMASYGSKRRVSLSSA